jgi:hypothetical protein
MSPMGDRVEDLTLGERFQVVIQFGKPDHPPSYEWAGIGDETILRGIKQGMPIEEVVDQSDYFVRGKPSSVSCLLMG